MGKSAESRKETKNTKLFYKYTKKIISKNHFSFKAMSHHHFFHQA
jgi:hypothetical protein